MATTVWFGGMSPNIAATFRRFPFPLILAALATGVVLAGINLPELTRGPEWERAFFGFATAAVCALAGVFFEESGAGARWVNFALKYLVPLAAACAFQVTDEMWLVPMLLPVAAVMWLSVSPVTRIGRGEERELQQNRFWWINHQAAASAGIAGVGFLAVALGLTAIERSFAVLFGLEIGSIVFNWLLPIVAVFLTPAYWLSTLPSMSDYVPAATEQPEFIAHAEGVLGQFVLVPLLAIYAAILAAYAVQIVITQQLPSGMIGWMVLGFVVAGAATWLLLHPPFMRGRLLVRQFRRWWFWLTIVPLLLFAVAVWVRVDAYGLTGERVLLIVGGVWAAMLTAAFLAGRGDIRLIPALAGIMLLALSVGPWNFMALPIYDQAGRLSALLAKGDPSGSGATPQWNDAEQAAARSAIDYLYFSQAGAGAIERVLAQHGIDYDTEGGDARALIALLGYPEAVPDAVPPRPELVTVPRSRTAVVDVSATPFHLGPVLVYGASATSPGLGLSVEGNVLQLWRDGTAIASQDLSPWVAGLSTVRLEEPWVDFAVGGQRFRLVLSTVSWRFEEGDRRVVKALDGQLFSSQPDIKPN